jgi:hypothetical protein
VLRADVLVFWAQSFFGGLSMHTTHLRKVGDSVMLAVPPAMLDELKSP